MNKGLYIKKPLEVRFADFEAHLKFLIEALDKAKKDFIYYKQVAGELRVLVADKKPSNQLMLSIMKELHLPFNLPNPKYPPYK